MNFIPLDTLKGKIITLAEGSFIILGIGEVFEETVLLLAPTIVKQSDVCPRCKEIEHLENSLKKDVEK